mgnify:CR=1 FL=1
MKIWVDADACPVAIKEILFRVANRAQILVTLVANRSIKTPSSKYIKMLTVMSGFDVADNEIVKRVEPGDLVITSDIPLADEVITKGGMALSSRGELFSKDTIKQRLNMRDFMDTMRSSGIQSSGPPPLSNSDKHQFGNHLDRIVANAKN